MAKAKKVKQVTDALIDAASSQKLHGAVDDLQKLGAAGEDALTRVPKDLSVDDTVKAMEDARNNIVENERIYSQGKGRKDVINEARKPEEEKMLPAVVDNTDYAKQAHDKQIADAEAKKRRPAERAIEVLNDPNASPEKKAAAERILNNRDISRNSGKNSEVITENNPNPERGEAARQKYETDRANRKGLTLEERVLRNEQGESHSLRTKEIQEAKVKELERKQANADKALERKRKSEIRQEQQATEQATKQKEQQRVDDAFGKAQDKIDSQNRTLRTKILEGTQTFLHNTKEVITGESRRRAAQFASEYNDILRKNGQTNFVDIQGGRNLQWKHEGMTAQQVYDAQQAASEEAAAKAQEFSQWWAGKADGLSQFAKDNPIITAAGIAGTAVVGASLLDND